ncbi:MAG: outer membrane beta-barrel protein [Desulfobacterales bacterium]|nr:MAG: outer membrane beta-barrel protein [Desulfobacterales bacterium]
MSSLKTCAVLFLAISLAMVLPGDVPADEFKLIPSVAVREEYNDNIFFDPKDEEDDFITTITPGLELINRTERLDLNLAVGISPFFYADNTDLNDVDQDYGGNINYRLTPRLNAAADASYLVDNRPDRDVETSGLVQNAKTRRRQHYGAGLNYALSEKAGTSLSYAYDRDDFDSDQDRNKEYESHTAGLGFTYNLSQWVAATIGRLNFGYANYDYRTSETDYYFGSVGVLHNFTEIWSLLVDVGARYTDSEFERRVLVPPATIQTVNDDDSGWGGIGQAVLEYRGETTRTSLTGSHDISAASGRTGVVQRTKAVFDVRRRFTEKLVFGFSAGYYLNKADEDEFGSNEIDEETFRIQPRIRWEFFDNFTLEAAYSYNYENDDANDTSSNRSKVFLQVAYGLPLFE